MRLRIRSAVTGCGIGDPINFEKLLQVHDGLGDRVSDSGVNGHLVLAEVADGGLTSKMAGSRSVIPSGR